MALENPRMCCNVFSSLKGIPGVAGMTVVVNDDTNIEWILVLIAVIGVVVDEDIGELAK
jgi:hypothetical protein